MRLLTDRALKRVVRREVALSVDRTVESTVNAIVGAVTDVSWGFLTVDQAVEKLRSLSRFWDEPVLSESSRNNIRYLLVDLDTRLKKGKS